MIVNGDAKMNATESRVNFKSAELTNFTQNSGITLTKGGEGTNALSIKLSGFKAVNETATVTVVIENPHDFDVTVKKVQLVRDEKKNASGITYLEVSEDFGTTVRSIPAGQTTTFTFTVTCKASSADAVTENFELRLITEAGSTQTTNP